MNRDHLSAYFFVPHLAHAAIRVSSSKGVVEVISIGAIKRMLCLSALDLLIVDSCMYNVHHFNCILQFSPVGSPAATRNETRNTRNTRNTREHAEYAEKHPVSACSGRAPRRLGRIL